MKRNLFKYLFFSASTLMACAALTACDDVKEADRLIPVVRPDVARKVLMMEFTGINCVNCPTGAAMAHTIQETYPGAVIVVGLHPGGTGFSGPIGTFNLNTDLARVYYDRFKPEGFPAAMVDGGNTLTNTEMWPKAVDDAIALPAIGEIEITPDYSDTDRSLKISYKVSINQAVTKPLNINLWITENGIVGPQKSGSTLIFDYVHNHVLRGSATGDWGIKLADSCLAEDEFHGEASITLDQNWVADNCEIVAFLQTQDMKIGQAACVPVIANE